MLLLFLAAVALVNPIREMPYDDDWAFSETVKHLLDTGQYRLNAWLAPNMPFQTIWGALFCLPAGYSFSALRISTLVLFVVGLVAFRELALEHDLKRGTANLLTLCLASSPLVFKLSLTYLSDVPFLATTLVAVLFYTRALRGARWLDWLVAATAASATIFIRQFGMAILGGLALVWLFDRQRFARFGEYFVGALFPTMSTLWQLQQGWNQSNWRRRCSCIGKSDSSGEATSSRGCRGESPCWSNTSPGSCCPLRWLRGWPSGGRCNRRKPAPRQRATSRRTQTRAQRERVARSYSSWSAG